MAKNDRILVWVLIVIAVLLIHSMGYIKIPGLQAAGGVEDKQTEGGGLGTLCLHDGSTMTVGPVQRRYKPTESVVSSDGDYARVYIDGVDYGLKADSSTMEVVTPTRIGGTDGSAVEIYYAENSSNYYAAKQAFTVPCVSAFSTGARPDSDAYLVVANASSDSVTFSAYTDDDSMKCADGAYNEAIAADDTANVKLKIDFPGKRGFSPHGDVIVTAKFNDSAYDQQNMDLTSNDVTISPGTTPTFRSSDNGTAAWAMKTWKFPGYDSLSTTVVVMNLHLDSSTLDPSSTNTAGHVLVFLDDEDYYRDSETGKMGFGAENNEQADVGYTSEISETIWVT